MATEVERLAVLVEANTRQFTRAMDRLEKDARKSTTNSSKSIQSLERNLTQLGRNARRALAVFGVGVGGGAIFSKFISSTIEQQKVLAQLDAVLQSTGGAAGFTARELTDMAAALQKVTAYGDETIINAEGLLLTFTKIGRDVFPEALEVVLDMSTALGQGLKESAVSVGKALQDPVLGVTALRRVGVNFSDSQKDVIKRLVETNRLADAQALILRELQVEFGGSARAARNTLGGAIDGLKNAFGDLFEVSREGSSDLIDSINNLTDILSSQETQSAIQNFGAWMFDAFAGAIKEGERLAAIISAINSGRGMDAIRLSVGGPGYDKPWDDPLAAERRYASTLLRSGLFKSSTSFDDFSDFGTRGQLRGGGGSPPGDDDLASSVSKSANAYDRLSKSLENQIANLSRSTREQEIANAVLSLGTDATEAQRQGIMRLAGEYYDLRTAQERVNEATEYFNDIAVDALSEIIFRGGTAEDVLRRIVLQLAEAAFRAALLGESFGGINFGGTGGGGGGVFGGIVKGLTSLFLPGFASGGSARKGQPIRVGEQGPEVFVPSTSGMIVPHSGGMPGAGGVVRVLLTLSDDLNARIEEVSAPVAVEVTRQGIAASNKQQGRQQVLRT